VAEISAGFAVIGLAAPVACAVDDLAAGLVVRLNLLDDAGGDSEDLEYILDLCEGRRRRLGVGRRRKVHI
jgi:hypothetical protein